MLEAETGGGTKTFFWQMASQFFLFYFFFGGGAGSLTEPLHDLQQRIQAEKGTILLI